MMYGDTTKPSGAIQNHIDGFELYSEASHWALHWLQLQLHMKNIMEFISTMDMMIMDTAVVNTVHIINCSRISY